MKRPLAVRLVLTAFNQWEQWTSEPLESILGSSRLTGLAGEGLSLLARGGALQQRWLRTWGVTSREDQERAQHSLNELQSQLYDLEDQLDEQQGS